MYGIEETESGLLLHFYPGSKSAGTTGRYGWGPVDSIEGRAGRPVLFEIEAEASSWIEAREQFARGAKIVPVEKRGRGRPPSGSAATAAERKRRQRARTEAKIWGEADIKGEAGQLTLTDLLEGIASAVRSGAPAIVRELAGELEELAGELERRARLRRPL